MRAQFIAMVRTFHNCFVSPRLARARLEARIVHCGSCHPVSTAAPIQNEARMLAGKVPEFKGNFRAVESESLPKRKSSEPLRYRQRRRHRPIRHAGRRLLTRLKAGRTEPER